MNVGQIDHQNIKIITTVLSGVFINLKGDLVVVGIGPLVYV